jgi:hypothetical protein
MMSPQKKERRYDHVQIKNIVDGTIIEGHDAVQAQVEREQKLLADLGASLIFQVYRLNLHADTLEALQGKQLAEIKVDGSFVSEIDTVAVVKDKVRFLLKEKARMENNGQVSVDLIIEAADHLTLYFSGRPLQEDTAFYADNAILLPAWIQVLLHRCASEEAVQRINKLQK